MKRLVVLALPAIVLLFPAPGIAQENAPKGADNGRLEREVGIWKTETTDKPAKWAPEGRKRSALESVSPILKKRFLLGRMLDATGEKGLWLMTHDPKDNAYPFWYFTSGVRGGEWSSTWDRSGRTFTGKATNTPPGWSSQAITRVLDANTKGLSAWMKDETGTLLFSSESKKTRQPTAAENEMLAQWNKHQPNAAVPPEMKVLEPLLGTWKVTSVFKKAEWTPTETRSTSKVNREWVLDGHYLQDTSDNADGTESLSLFTYDPDMKAYRSWWFSSEGHSNKSAGRWDAAARTIAFQGDLGNGLSMRGSVHFLDEGNDWETIVTGADGKVYFQGQWQARRK